jgi:hypothetical protein
MKALLAIAALLVLAYGIARLAGMRDAVATLSGTAAPATQGLVYVVLHFALVVIVPILLIATAILGALRLARRTP